MPTRARNQFVRAGLRTVADIEDITPRDMLDWRNMGAGTLEEIYRLLAREAAEGALRCEVREFVEDYSPPRSGRAFHEAPTPTRPQYVLDLYALAEWMRLIGSPDRPLLAGSLPDWAPVEVKEAHERLLGLTADDLTATADDRPHDFALRLDELLYELDDRARSILARRFFADVPDKLDAIGQELDVTRERVRQIEGKAHGRLLSTILPGGELASVAGSVRDAIGELRPLTDLLEVLPTLRKECTAVRQPAWRVIDRLDDAYEIVDGWCASPTVTAARERTLTSLAEAADENGLVRLDALPPLPSTSPLWFEYCGLGIAGGYLLTRLNSVNDRAIGVLAAAGSPLSSSEIHERLGVARSIQSVRNALGSDERFTRVDRDTWALASWEMNEYTNIRDLIRGAVARSGGAIELPRLISTLTSQFSITESSVFAYANAAPFEVKDGVVRLANTQRETRKTPERTRRLYRGDREWLLRERITNEHMRGSGTTVPSAVAGIVGLNQGEATQLACAYDPQSFTWRGTQPAIGSIRRILTAKDVELDAEVFLALTDDRQFDIRPVEPLTGDDLKDALALTGATDRALSVGPRVALAEAIGLPASSPASSLIGAYRDRGDGDIADRLLAAKDQLDPPEPVSDDVATDISAILDLL
jgi:hypothetical protein